MVILLLDERRRHAPDGKRPHPHRMGKTEGKHQKAGVVRHSRHEGLAPVRYSQRPETGLGLLRANSCRTSVRSACLFPRGLDPRSRALSYLGIMARGSVDRGVPFSRSSGPRPLSGTNNARASAILKTAPAPSPRLKRQGRTRNEDQETTHEPIRTGNADAARVLL